MMKTDLKITAARCALIVLLTTFSQLSRAATLFAHGNDDHLYRLDTATLSATSVGPNNVSSILSEIEQSPYGSIFGSDTFVNTNLYSISPATGAAFNIQTMTFPEGGDVITAMEFVGQTLYAGFTTEGIHTGSAATSLVTIDLLNGAVSIVGDTGIPRPLGGLAFDGTTMYAVSAGGSGSLYTIDLETGAATLIGDTGFRMTALEFGINGVLYGLPRSRSPFANHLLQIDTTTGIASNLGLIEGAPGSALVSLTSTPGQAAAVEVAVDIMPGNRENPVNPDSGGRIRVAIQAAGAFDASVVDATTVRFGPGAAAPLNYWLAVGGHGDGRNLVLMFDIRETGIACGDIEAILTGQTFSGVRIAGSDSVRTAACRNGP